MSIPHTPSRRDVLSIGLGLGVIATTAGCDALTRAGGGSGNGKSLPATVTIGAPAVAGTRQSIMGAQGIARVKGWLQAEFQKDGTRFDFPGFRGGAATVNQALANKQVDLAYAGDLVSIIGHSAGVDTRLIMPCGRFENAYLAVPPNSTIRSIPDLRGRSVAYFKGSYLHLQVVKILAAHGMTEADIKSTNLDYSTAATALANGDVEALFGGLETLALKDRGVARFAYSTHGQDPRLTGQAGVLVRRDFAEHYPEVVTRMVKTWVKAAQWASEPAHRDEVFQLWAAGNRTPEQMRENYGDRPLEVRLSPLLDPFFLAQYKRTQELAQQLGLLRGKPFDIDQWFDRRYLETALRDLSLQNRWTALNPQGDAA